VLWLHPEKSIRVPRPARGAGLIRFSHPPPFKEFCLILKQQKASAINGNAQPVMPLVFFLHNPTLIIRQNLSDKNPLKNSIG
jgi:hypothetical protein